MNKLCRGPLEDATYQISKLLAFHFQRRKNFEICLLCFYAPTCDPQGRTNPDSRGILWTNLEEVPKEMSNIKYQISMPSSFSEEKFWRLASLFLCSNLWPQGAELVLTKGLHMNKLCRGPQGDAIYQISKLSTFQFQSRILKFAFFIPMF